MRQEHSQLDLALEACRMHEVCLEWSDTEHVSCEVYIPNREDFLTLSFPRGQSSHHCLEHCLQRSYTHQRTWAPT